MTEDSRKHLDFVQGVITRMAGNSFALKAWSVTILAGIFALGSGGGASKVVPWIAAPPLLLFWILDAYFLGQERLYRKLYDHLRKLSDSEWEDLGGRRYSLAPEDYGLSPEPVAWVMMRGTLVYLYAALLSSAIIFGLCMCWFRP